MMENTVNSRTDRLLRVSEVAEMLAMSPAYVYQLIQNRDLSAVILGRSRRVRLEDVESFITANISPRYRGQIDYNGS